MLQGYIWVANRCQLYVPIVEESLQALAFPDVFTQLDMTIDSDVKRRGKTWSASMTRRDKLNNIIEYKLWAKSLMLETGDSCESPILETTNFICNIKRN